MKASNKMKALSLAVLGLAGMAFGSSALAVCPTDPAQPNGPWSGKTQTQGTVTIVDGGLDGSSCAMESKLNVGASGFAAATVRDDSPVSEPRYRARFLINADTVLNLGSFAAAQVFSASSQNAYPAINGFTPVIRLSISGAANNGKNINIITACEGQSGNLCTSSTPLQAGVNSIEIDWKLGAGNGYLKYWVNGNTEGTPTGTISNINNNGWVGIESANLGVAGANSLFRGNNANQPVKLDTFDSRRTTFIGS